MINIKSSLSRLFQTVRVVQSGPFVLGLSASIIPGRSSGQAVPVASRTVEEDLLAAVLLLRHSVV